MDDESEEQVKLGGIDFYNAMHYYVHPYFNLWEVRQETNICNPYASPQTLLGIYCPATTNMVWCLGIMLWKMLFFQFPYNSFEFESTIRSVVVT